MPINQMFAGEIVVWMLVLVAFLAAQSFFLSVRMFLTTVVAHRAILAWNMLFCLCAMYFGYLGIGLIAAYAAREGVVEIYNDAIVRMAGLQALCFALSLIAWLTWIGFNRKTTKAT